MTRPFIIAEMSANHNGSLDRALAIVKAAAEAGASAIKLQTYKPESMVADENYVISSGPWAGIKLIDLYRKGQTPYRWHQPIFDLANKLGIFAFSSPFDSDAVDFLETLGCPIYKIASFELVDLPLIRKAASTGKPMIMSMGMATYQEVEEAVQAARSAGCSDITLLKCTSGYPAPENECNLIMLPQILKFGCRIGISDHTTGIGVAVAAVTIGAMVLEKHLTLSRSDGGPDAEFSLEPDEFKQMVTECNRASDAVGHLHYGATTSEFPQLALRRSLYFARSLSAGEIITYADVRTARPALGLMPRELPNVVGKQVTADVSRGQAVTWEVMA
jgi:pseudaminic acid synthase